MSKPEPNLIQSISARLKNKAKEEDEEFNYVLPRYGAERLLYRLSVSEYKDKYILKGGTLFLAWHGKSYRVTRDIDFLGYGSSEVTDIENIFRQLCQLEVKEDGLIFLPETVKG